MSKLVRCPEARGGKCDAAGRCSHWPVHELDKAVMKCRLGVPGCADCVDATEKEKADVLNTPERFVRLVRKWQKEAATLCAALAAFDGCGIPNSDAQEAFKFLGKMVKEGPDVYGGNCGGDLKQENGRVIK